MQVTFRFSPVMDWPSIQSSARDTGNMTLQRIKEFGKWMN